MKHSAAVSAGAVGCPGCVGSEGEGEDGAGAGPGPGAEEGSGEDAAGGSVVDGLLGSGTGSTDPHEIETAARKTAGAVRMPVRRARGRTLAYDLIDHPSLAPIAPTTAGSSASGRSTVDRPTIFLTATPARVVF